MRFNERIDELMIRAGARFEFLHGVHYDDFQYREFARLIVRECMAMCKTSVGNADYNTGRLHCLENIKEHFGIEE